MDMLNTHHMINHVLSAMQWTVNDFSKLGNDTIVSDSFEAGLSTWWAACMPACVATHAAAH